MEPMNAMQIQDAIAGSFQDAGDFLNFMRSDTNNPETWASVNGVEIESEREYKEAISRIQIAAKEEAIWLMENLIKRSNSRVESFRHGLLEQSASEVIFDHFEDNNFDWLKVATKEEIEAIAEMSFDEARERIEADGTLF